MKRKRKRRKNKGSKEWRHYLEVRLREAMRNMPPVTFKQEKQS